MYFSQILGRYPRAIFAIIFGGRVPLGSSNPDPISTISD